MPPELVPQVWPHVWEMLKKAIDKTDYGTFACLENDVFSANALLWLAWSEPTIGAALVTQLVRNENSIACYILACGGKEHRAWRCLPAPIEAYAKVEGCKKLRILGRKGWAKMFEGCRVPLVVIEKDII